MELPFGLNPFENDPGAWGASALNNAELLLGCLDAVNADSVIEVGAYAGDLTRLLILWGAEREVKVAAIDPSPQPELEQLARDTPSLRLIRQTSLDALADESPADAYVLDGDHNYYTVTEELRLIATAAERAGRALPLLILHDVCWPHARRDDYYDPEQIPAEHRQPVSEGGGLYPGVEGVRPGGLPYRWPAAREGGPRNGVLTAVEDFVSANEGLRLAVVPSFFGLGVVFATAGPAAPRLGELLDPWDGNPWLARLERNRVLHLASSHVQLNLARDAERRFAQATELLDRMLVSRAFAGAEWFLRLRQRGRPVFSRREIRRLLGREE